MRFKILFILCLFILSCNNEEVGQASTTVNNPGNGDDNNNNDDPDFPDWSSDTHGNDTAPNYTEVFSDENAIRRIDIVFEPENWALILEDMTSLYGAFGQGSGGGPGGGGPGGGGPLFRKKSLRAAILVARGLRMTRNALPSSGTRRNSGRYPKTRGRSVRSFWAASSTTSLVRHLTMSSSSCESLFPLNRSSVRSDRNVSLPSCAPENRSPSDDMTLSLRLNRTKDGLTPGQAVS